MPLRHNPRLPILVACACLAIAVCGKAPDTALLEQLGSADIPTRINALQRICETGDASIIQYCLASLHDENPFIRVEAINGLNLFPQQETIVPLALALSDDFAVVAAAAARVLAFHPHESAREVLRDYALNGTMPGRIYAIRALGFHSSHTAQRVLAAIAAGDPDATARAEALRALAGYAEGYARSIIREALGATSAQVRSAAASAAGMVNDREAIPLLRTALSDSDPEVRLAAVDALGRMHDTPSAQRLFTMLETEAQESPTLPVNPVILQSLKEMDDVVIAVLIPALEQPEGQPAARQLALRVLSDISNARVVPILLQALDAADDDSDRRAILHVLAAPRNMQHLIPIHTFLGDPLPYRIVQSSARRWYPLHEPPMAVTALLAHTDEQMRIQAILALAMLCGPRAFDILQPMYETAQETGVRKALIQALLQSDEVRAVGTVLPNIFAQPVAERELGIRELRSVRDGRALPVLLEISNNNNWQLRLTTRTLLREISDARLVEPILEKQKAEGVSPYSFITLADILGATGDARIIDAFIPLLENPTPGDWYAASYAKIAAILGASGDLRTRMVLQNSMNNANPLIKSAATAAYARLTGDADALTQCVAELHSSNDEVFQYALEAIAERRPTFAQPVLANIVQTGTLARRYQAAEVLAGYGDAGKLPLWYRLLNDEFPKMRELAIHTLAAMRDPAAVLPLRRAMRCDHLPGLRVAAAGALLQLGDEGGLDILLAATQSADLSQRYRALISLQHAHSGIIDAALARALQQPDAITRALSAAALLEAGDERAFAPLLQSLNASEGPYATTIACQAFARMRDTRALGALISLLRDTSRPEERIAAVIALGTIGKEGADTTVPPLLDTLNDNDPRLIEQTVIALGAIADSRASDALIQLLSTPMSRIRLQAVIALGNIKEEKALPTLEKLLETEKSTPIRDATKNALQQIRG